MVSVTQDEAEAIAAVTKLILSWAREIDRNEGLGLAPFIAADCRYAGRDGPVRGSEGVVGFYRDRIDALRRTPAGPPVKRHVITNLLVDLLAPAEASVDFLLAYYSSPGEPPVTLEGPLSLADCHMDCVLEADGQWRIASFSPVQTFLRNAA